MRMSQGFLDKGEEEDDAEEESKGRGQMGRIFGPLIDMVDKVRNSSALKPQITIGTQVSSNLAAFGCWPPYCH